MLKVRQITLVAPAKPPTLKVAQREIMTNTSDYSDEKGYDIYESRDRYYIRHRSEGSSTISVPSASVTRAEYFEDDDPIGDALKKSEAAGEPVKRGPGRPPKIYA